MNIYKTIALALTLSSIGCSEGFKTSLQSNNTNNDPFNNQYTLFVGGSNDDGSPKNGDGDPNNGNNNEPTYCNGSPAQLITSTLRSIVLRNQTMVASEVQKFSTSFSGPFMLVPGSSTPQVVITPNTKLAIPFNTQGMKTSDAFTRSFDTTANPMTTEAVLKMSISLTPGGPAVSPKCESSRQFMTAGPGLNAIVGSSEYSCELSANQTYYLNLENCSNADQVFYLGSNYGIKHAQSWVRWFDKGSGVEIISGVNSVYQALKNAGIVWRTNPSSNPISYR